MLGLVWFVAEFVGLGIFVSHVAGWCYWVGNFYSVATADEWSWLPSSGRGHGWSSWNWGCDAGKECGFGVKSVAVFVINPCSAVLCGYKQPVSMLSIPLW